MRIFGEQVLSAVPIVGQIHQKEAAVAALQHSPASAVYSEVSGSLLCVFSQTQLTDWGIPPHPGENTPSASYNGVSSCTQVLPDSQQCPKVITHISTSLPWKFQLYLTLRTCFDHSSNTLAQVQRDCCPGPRYCRSPQN